MLIMDSLTLLKMTSKEDDHILCDKCKEGIFVPFNPDFEVNHTFYCNKCGAEIHMDGSVTVE